MNKNLKKYIAYNRTALENSGKTLKDIFEIMFHEKDNILCEGNDGFRTYKYTYGEMKDRIEVGASALFEKIGATHEYVALEMDNSPNWITAFWSILKSGNKPYLVNLRYPQSLTDGIIKTLNIKYVVCEKESEIDALVITADELTVKGKEVPSDVFENEIAFSSSATSMNETVCFYTGYQISEQILNFKDILRESPRIAKHYKGSLKQLAFLPFYHVFGLFAVYFWFTFFGRTLVFLRDMSAETILKTVNRHEVTHIFAVPMLWHTIETKVWSSVRQQGEKKEKKLRKALTLMTKLQNIFPSFGPEIAKFVTKELTDKLFGRSVLFCISGGSYLRDSAMSLMNGIGYSLHNGYGMSEIGITSVELRKKPKDRNKNSIGHPFSSLEYKLDENGVLLVKGSSLAKKKLVNGEEIILDEWFYTGDNMVEKDGHYYILGRMGDIVIGENGENINPDMVEKLFTLKGSVMLSVLGLSEKENEELSLVVQLNPYATADNINAIINEAYKINSTLDSATSVRKFYFTFDQLAPPTAIKVSRTQLKKKIASGEVTLTAFADMKAKAEESTGNSPLLKDVTKIIAEVLSINPDDITPDSHIFYDLGASSIQYFSIVIKLAEHFNVSQESDNEKYSYTPREICEYIERLL